MLIIDDLKTRVCVNFLICIIKMHAHLIAQLYPTLCDSMDCSPPGSSVRVFSRQEYWRGLPFPMPGDLPNPGIIPKSSALQANSLLFEPPVKPYNENTII